MRLPLALAALLALAEPPPGCADCADAGVIEQAGLLYATTGTPDQVSLARRINGLIEGGGPTLLGHVPGAQPTLGPADAWRLAHQTTYVTSALAGFYAARPRAPGLDTVLDLIGRRRAALDPAALAGDWQCRKHRVDGARATVTTFRWFACRITPRPGGLRLEKTGGSERIAGDVAWAGDVGVLAGCEAGAAPCAYDPAQASRRVGVLAFDTPRHGTLLRIDTLGAFDLLDLSR